MTDLQREEAKEIVECTIESLGNEYETLEFLRAAILLLQSEPQDMLDILTDNEMDVVSELEDKMICPECGGQLSTVSRPISSEYAGCVRTAYDNETSCAECGNSYASWTSLSKVS